MHPATSFAVVSPDASQIKVRSASSSAWVCRSPAASERTAASSPSRFDPPAAASALTASIFSARATWHASSHSAVVISTALRATARTITARFFTRLSP
jgi:hypothetical protein